MSESTWVIARTEEAGTEVELNAQELLALSESRHSEEHETRPTPQPSKPATSAALRKLDAPRASTNRQLSAWRLSLSLVATVGIVGPAYVFTSSDRAKPSMATAPQRTAQSAQPAPEQLVHGEPVRFANPFDADEVFEFPPGTTETDARDAVAELLLERAMSRQKT